MFEIPSKLYKKIQEVLPIACVDIAIKNRKGEFLLCKRNNEPAKGQWWVPGGRVLKGETLEKAALRKIKEETGLNVKLEKILGADETIFKKGVFGGSVHTITVVFLAKVEGSQKVKLDSQHRRFHWFKRAHPTFHPYLKKFLKLAGAR